MGAHDLCLSLMHAPLQFEWPGDDGHHRVVAIVADPHLHLVIKIDAFDVLEKAVHKVLPRLLAVGQDVHARVLLGFDP